MRTSDQLEASSSVHVRQDYNNDGLHMDDSRVAFCESDVSR